MVGTGLCAGTVPSRRETDGARGQATSVAGRLCKVRARSWRPESCGRFKREGGLFRPVGSRYREKKLAGVARLKETKCSSPETQQLCPIQGQKSQKTAPSLYSSWVQIKEIQNSLCGNWAR